ncbi:MAG: endolytic transglycosylase MltG [Actinobacteria bacterium]|nr:endolytic transglycosylase MltG [Actinomycetota bacterium]
MSKKFLPLFIAAIVLAGFFAVGISFLRSSTPIEPDYPTGVASTEVLVNIPVGASGSDIANLLLKMKITKSFGAFFALAVADTSSSTIAPGTHRLHTRIPARQALKELLDPNRIPDLIRIREGARTDEVLTQMVGKGFKRSDLLSALSAVLRPIGIVGNEGILFPAQYSFAAKTTALKALQSMVDRFSSEARVSGLLSGTADFTPIQLLTIASLVQAEGDEKDFGKISQVVRNRIKIGMPLQFDTTVHYVTRTRGQVFLSTEETRIQSPYNTYLHYGLPPGPIGNPGRAAMDAALRPTPGDWLYFITVKPGDTRFTKRNEQFLLWKSEYEKNMNAGAFGTNP